MEGFADVRAGPSQFEAVLAGNSVVRVDYVAPSSAQDERRVTPKYDRVRMGVELETQEGATCAVAWKMAGVCEGLMMGSGRVESLRSYDMALRRADRTRAASWQPFIGTPVLKVRTDWQISADGCPPTVWAVQLDFGVRSLTIAMGEAGPDGPSYQPDELLVIFDRALANTYRIPAAIELGDDVGHE